MEAIVGKKGYFRSKIIFLSEPKRPAKDATKDVFIVDQDGYNLKKLTNGGKLIMYPSFFQKQNLLLYTDITNGEPQMMTINSSSGEIKNAKTAAQTIYTARLNRKIETINDLKSILQKLAPRGKENKYFAQVFQALRIVVNEEMVVLEDFLKQTPEVLAPDGRLVVMSYHSLEDRLVKNFIRSGKFSGEVEKDLFGNDIKPLESVIRKAIEASPEEVEQNPRARSAKLRIAEPTPLK
jgi:16S rRNA C1402 N4-methylase RsmH